MNEIMRELLGSESMAVLSTCVDNRPHCSLMAYIVGEEDGVPATLYMITHRETRKYTNIQTNPRVSLLVDSRLRDGLTNRVKLMALTIEGRVEVIEEPGRREMITSKFCSRHPHLSDFARSDSAAVLAIRMSRLQLLEGATRATYARLEEDS